MSTEDAFFKIRPTKRSNPEARTTLDTVHQVQLNAMIEREKQVGELENNISELEDKIQGSDDIQYEITEQQIKALQKEVEKRKGGNEVYDYFLNAGELLYQYYDVQERINNGAEGVSKNSMYKSKPGDILSSLQSAAEPSVSTGQPVGERLRRDKILETYLQKVDPEHARSTTEVLNDPYGECEDCEVEMIFSQNEALFTGPPRPERRSPAPPASVRART